MTPPAQEQLSNLETGGECSVFELIDELMEAFQNDRQLIDRLLSTLKPDCLTDDDRKITWKKVAKMAVESKK